MSVQRKASKLPLVCLFCLTIGYSQGFLDQSSYRRTLIHEHKERSHKINSLLTLNAAPEDTKPKKNKISGVYSRPSAAIERGSGFFVPGLEGPKVRLAVGFVLLILTAVNHAYANTAGNAGNTFSEGLAVVYCLLVLFQGAVEFSREMRGTVVVGQQNSRSPQKTYQQQWSIPTDDEWKDRIEWAAQSYLALTPATHMMLVGPGKVLYSLGSTDQPEATDETSQACQAALETLSSSKSGRVSLPSTHPVATGLAPIEHNRCIVLQRVDDDEQLCWVMTSNELLASFTKQDLQWLGQLARYVQP